MLIRRGRILKPRPTDVTLLGIDLGQAESSFAGRFHASPNASANLVSAKLAGRPAALAVRRFADRIGAASQLELLVDGNNRRVLLAGTIEEIDQSESILDGNVLVMDLDQAAGLAGAWERVSRLDVVLSANADREEVRANLERFVAGEARVRTSKSAHERADEMLGGLTTAFSLCGIGAMVAGMLLIHNVYSISVAERRQIAGVLRALGATRMQLLGAFALESVLFGLLGGLAGLPAACLLARVAAGPIQQVLSEVFLPLSGSEPLFSARVCIAGLVIGMAASLAAGLWPALRAAGVNPIEPLRRLAESPPGGLHRRSIFLAGLLAAAAGILHARVRSLHWGPWPSLVCLVFAGLVAAPPLACLLAWLLRPLVRRWLGLGGLFALENLLRWPRRYGFVMATLAGGMALLLQTGGVIRGNEEALRDWLDRSVIGDLFVTSGGPLSASGQNLPMSDDLASIWRQQVPGLKVVPMRFRHVEWQQGDRAARLLLVLLDAPAYQATIDERFPD
jgi:putative ABC transport system permease protein